MDREGMLCVLARPSFFQEARRRGPTAAAAALIAALAMGPTAAPAAGPSGSPTAANASGETITTPIPFASEAADLSATARRTLDRLVARAGDGETPRLRLIAHAGAGSDEAEQALRLSLSRVLTVRSYLVEHGIHSSRLDARAVGNRSEDGGPGDRVDIVMIDR